MPVSSWRRTVIASLGVFVLAIGGILSVHSAPAQAHQAVANTRPMMSHGAMSSIHINGTAINTAHTAATFNCSGRRTFWYELVGPRVSYPDYVLQSNLWVLLDYYTSSWCGQAYAEGLDHLLQNCHTFRGLFFINGFGYSGNFDYSVYHCTATYYDFIGSVQSPPCSSGQYLISETQADYWAGWNGEDSPRFYC